MPSKELCLSVPSTPSAVVDARRRLSAQLRVWQLSLPAEALHDIELVAGELLANAVDHASQGGASVVVRLDGAVLRIEVCDSSDALPRRRSPGLDEESGRGLCIVAALADRWGAEHVPPGKRCWAEFGVVDGLGCSTSPVGGSGFTARSVREESR
ncbi:ATP-binding protein [Streptomyces sp. NPDC020731]|uniref:ATP-binding protein n=1 Tax=Streptomyces sp. NPDC020731 TaxID=3365085 RepID=UPI0037AC3127